MSKEWWSLLYSVRIFVSTLLPLQSEPTIWIGKFVYLRLYLRIQGSGHWVLNKDASFRVFSLGGLLAPSLFLEMQSRRHLSRDNMHWVFLFYAYRWSVTYTCSMQSSRLLIYFCSQGPLTRIVHLYIVWHRRKRRATSSKRYPSSTLRKQQ